MLFKFVLLLKKNVKTQTFDVPSIDYILLMNRCNEHALVNKFEEHLTGGALA